jgi:putative ATPase
MDLFSSAHVPLAERMRPKTLDDFIGQEHLLGPGMLIRRAIEQKQLPSVILWGPPGVGKTTLAGLIASTLDRPFFSLSAIQAGVKDVRYVIEQASTRGDAILFIDEVHRFNKAQQDSLLGAVEKGIVKLIGATTENPSFEVISALLSRCQVCVLEPLSPEQMKLMISRALEKDHVLKDMSIEISEYDALFRYSGGDGRKLLNLLEICAMALGQGAKIDNKAVAQTAQQQQTQYDKSGEQHYDIVSAFIKSMRGSDPNAAVYWLARMIEGGEDPKFIARRMLILASEDIGNANPNALLMANSCFQAIQVIGYPECRIILSQAAIYLANSVKSNSSYTAIGKAQALVREHGDLSVPLHLRNAPTKLMKELNYGKDYAYAHDEQGNFIESDFMPEELQGHRIYEPGDNPREAQQRQYLKSLWKDRYGY